MNSSNQLMELATDIVQYQSSNLTFVIGDVVRSYRCGFDNQKPFRNSYIEGIVEAVETTVSENDTLLVRWLFNNLFGHITPCNLPHNNERSFHISTRSPWLVKVTKGQLLMPL